MYINLTMFFHILSVDIQGPLIAQIHVLCLMTFHILFKKIKSDKLHSYFCLNFSKNDTQAYTCDD